MNVRKKNHQKSRETKGDGLLVPSHELKLSVGISGRFSEFGSAYLNPKSYELLDDFHVVEANRKMYRKKSFRVAVLRAG